MIVAQSIHYTVHQRQYCHRAGLGVPVR